MAARPAPLWRLVAAAAADALLGLVAWSLAAMWLVIAVLAFRVRPLDVLDVLILALAILALGVILHVVYHTVLVGGCGQTLGKMLMGVAVVRRDGAPAGYGRALLRCVGGGLCLLTLGLGRLFVLFTRERRALSDFLAGTRPNTTPHPGPLP
jgi:Mce-associated membrane protein